MAKAMPCYEAKPCADRGHERGQDALATAGGTPALLFFRSLRGFGRCCFVTGFLG